MNLPIFEEVKERAIANILNCIDVRLSGGYTSVAIESELLHPGVLEGVKQFITDEGWYVDGVMVEGHYATLYLKPFVHSKN
jgi:hypothetical protein